MFGFNLCINLVIASYNLVEYGSTRCPTCVEFTSTVWEQLQEKMPIECINRWLENPMDLDRMNKDKAGENGIPAVWLYDGENPLVNIYAYNIDDESFPSSDEILKKVCIEIREKNIAIDCPYGTDESNEVPTDPILEVTPSNAEFMKKNTPTPPEIKKATLRASINRNNSTDIVNQKLIDETGFEADDL